MTVVDFTFPQSGDNDYSENFGTWLGRSAITDYIEEGMTFTVDYTVPEVTISQGKAFVEIPEKTISANSETRLSLDYVIIKPSKTISLSDNAVNFIYLNPNIGSNDSPSFNAYTNETNAASNSLKIGEIDTSSNTKDENFSRSPDSTFNTGSFSFVLNIPVYDDTSNAEGGQGNVIYVTGNGSESSGIYIDTGAGFKKSGIDTITELNDVDGVTALIEDSATNRPSPGTEGRIFFDTTNHKVEYDTGGSWTVLGQDPANIGSGDLGFDTATQNELDSHSSTNDAHHSRPIAGNGLKESSGNFNVEPDEFDGTFLSDDGTDNLTVNIGRGLENDGTGTIQFDEDTDYTFTTAIDFTAGLDTQGDITDSSQVIWDASVGEIPDSAMGSIANSTLTNDSITINANDGLKSGGTVNLGGTIGLDVEPANFAGTFLSDDGSDNLTVDISRGLENDGSGNISVDESTDFSFSSGITFNAGLDTQGNISDGTQIIWSTATQEIPDSALGSVDNSTLTNNSITINANDGLKSGGTVSLGGSVGLDVEPANFAGSGVEDDGSDNIRISSTAVGDGLKGGSGSTITIEPNDFAGTYLSDDGADNLAVDIGSGLEGDGSGNIRVDEDTDFTFTSTIDFSAGLDTQGNIKDGTQLIWDATNQEIPDSAMGSIANSTLTNNSITINANDGLKSGGTVNLGGSVGLDVEPADFSGTGTEDDGSDNLRVDEDYGFTFTSIIDFSAGLDTQGDISDGTQTIWSAANQEIPDSAMGSITNSTLSNSSVTVAGNSVSLGGSTAVNHNDLSTISSDDHHTRYSDEEAQDAVGTILTNDFNYDDDGNTIDLANDSITINANDGLKSGGTVSLGGSVGLDVEPADFAGVFLSDDGTDNLTVDIGRGLENDGSGNVRVDEDTDFTFTSTIDFSSGLDTQGDISDGSQTIWSATNQEIPDSAMGSIANSTLTNSSVTVSSGDGLTGGGIVSLGGSITLNIEPANFAGEHLADDGNDNLAVDIGDDSKLDLGTNDDVSVRYDSTNDDIRWEDSNSTTDRMALDRTTGDLTISGEFTEGATL
jgi:hypothetical protein